MMAFTSRQYHSTIMTMVGHTVFETVWLLWQLVSGWAA